MLTREARQDLLRVRQTLRGSVVILPKDGVKPGRLRGFPDNRPLAGKTDRVEQVRG